MRQRRFEVSRIHCQGCQQTISSALRGVDGIEQVDPDIDTDVVTVTYDDDRVTVDDISGRLRDAGFPVRQVSEEQDGGDATDTTQTSPGSVAGRYGLLVASVLAIALAGYVGYVLYPRFDLPAAQGAGLLVLAAAATFMLLAGIVIRAVVGALLVLLGLVQTGRLHHSMHAVEDAVRPLSRRSAELRREHPVAGFGLFGFGYVLAGFG